MISPVLPVSRSDVAPGAPALVEALESGSVLVFRDLDFPFDAFEQRFVERPFADGKANYTVVFVGSSGDLATQFRQATFQKRKVSVTAKSNNRVELTVAK